MKFSKHIAIEKSCDMLKVESDNLSNIIKIISYMMIVK
jgi:hypothetical protein